VRSCIILTCGGSPLEICADLCGSVRVCANLIKLFRSVRSEHWPKSVRVQIRKVLFRSGPICEVHCKYSGFSPVINGC